MIIPISYCNNSFFRFFAICYPMKVKSICTTRRAKIIIPILWIVSALYSIPNMFFLVRYIYIYIYIFFFKVFGGHMSFFLGPLVPLFWISGDVSSGFQSQSGFCLIRYFFCGGECNVHSPRFTSGATLANLLVAGTQPVTSPHACAKVGLVSVSNVRSHEQKNRYI